MNIQTPARTAEKRVKITNPERILRLMKRICSARLPVFMRSSENTGVVVKGRAARLSRLDPKNRKSPILLEIAGLSEKGVHFLANKQVVQVEFVMMATKVVFRSRIYFASNHSIQIGLPRTLVTIERRRNARFKTTNDYMAFIDFGVWKPHDDDKTTMPCLDHFSRLQSWIPIFDLSLGGFCAETSFPSLALSIGRGTIDSEAALVLPMQEPIPVEFEVRWSKKIKEHIEIEGEEGVRYLKSYKVGCEFTFVDEDVKHKILRFLKSLSQAKAV